MAKRRMICLALIFIFSMAGVLTSAHLAEMHYKKPKYVLNLINALPPLEKFIDRAAVEERIRESEGVESSGPEENPFENPDFDPYAKAMNPYQNIKTEKELKKGAVGEESCDLSEKFSCTTVDDSDYSEIMGIAVSLYGVAGYMVLAIFALIAMVRLRGRIRRTGKTDSAAEAAPDVFVFFIFAAGLAGFVFSAWLTYIEAVHIGAFCPYCILSSVLITFCLVACLAGYGLSPLRILSGMRQAENKPS